MKNVIVTCLLLLFYCCKENLHGQDNSNKIEKNQNTREKIEVLYNSDSIKRYFNIESDSINFNVTTMKYLKEFNFDSNSLLIPIKENEFEFTKLKKVNKYFIVKTFDFSNEITIKMLIYSMYGDNDTRIFNVQLNSYKNNKLIDQLLLDSRFTFETKYYRYFQINSNKTIEIRKYSINLFNYNESGDIIDENENNELNEETNFYIINKEGVFIKK